MELGPRGHHDNRHDCAWLLALWRRWFHRAGSIPLNPLRTALIQHVNAGDLIALTLMNDTHSVPGIHGSEDIRGGNRDFNDLIAQLDSTSCKRTFLRKCVRH